MRRLLIRGATLLTMDPTLGDLDGGDLLVEGSKIVAVGARLEVDASAAEVVDAEGMIVLPGFVNAHVHLWELPLRGLGGDWISHRDYHGNVHRNLAMQYDADDVHVANLMGALNQVNGGTTCVLDWCHVVRDAGMTDAAIDGIAATGLRAVFARGTHKPPPDASGAVKPYWETPYPREELVRLRAGRLASDDARITLGMATLGPDIATYEVARDEMRLAREFGVVHSAHTWGRRGKRRNEDGLWRLAKEGLLGPDHNIAHGNGLEDDELKMVLDHGCSVTATDLAEMMNSERIGMLGRVAKAGGSPSLGTDVCVYFNSAMLLELRHAFAHQREADNRELAARGEWPSEHHATRTRDAVEWATLGGAKALRLDHRIGSLTPGKEADLIMIDTRRMNVFPALPGGDPYHVVALYAENADIDSVMVGGDWLKRQGRLLFDADALAGHQARLLETRRALMSRGGYRYRPELPGGRP
ncbi:MAG: amidohydrolase family protein [Burkholderiales bacterium]|nr:amidohydrolase family protein [Burkholderiales bacterium]